MENRSHKLDRTDLNILRVLQTSGRITNLELSQKVNLTPGPCLARVKRLEREGCISNYWAELDSEQLGFSLLAYVEITLTNSAGDILDQFNHDVQDIPEIEECHMVAGDFDYLLKVRCVDIEDYRRILGDKIATLSGISHSHTYVVVEQVKNKHQLNI